MDALNQISEESQAKYLESIQKIEFEGINDEFQNLTKSCKTKCLDTTFNNPKLYKGEMVCLDKCASKYIEFKFKMQEIMTKHMEEKQKFLMSQMEMTEAYLEQKSKVLWQNLCKLEIWLFVSFALFHLFFFQNQKKSEQKNVPPR